MFMVKFSPTALDFGYDFVLSVHFLGHPVEGIFHSVLIVLHLSKCELYVPYLCQGLTCLQFSRLDFSCNICAVLLTIEAQFTTKSKVGPGVAKIIPRFVHFTLHKVLIVKADDKIDNATALPRW